MTLDAEKIVRLFELCADIAAVKNEIPTLSVSMLDGESREIQLEIARQLRPSLLTNHAAKLKELARLLR